MLAKKDSSRAIGMEILYIYRIPVIKNNKITGNDGKNTILGRD